MGINGVVQLHSPGGAPVSNIMVPWVHASLHSPNGTSIGSAALAGLHSVPNARTDIQTTERATCVATGGICAMHAMRPKSGVNYRGEC